MSTTTTSPPIPLCDLDALHAPLMEDLRGAIERVLQSSQFIMGPDVLELEKRIAQYCGAQHAIGCSSGSDALVLALMALDIGPGDEVITTPFTFFATAGAISRLGATPVFVDIEDSGYNIDPNLIEPAVTDRTKAIIPVHLFGQMAEMDPVMEIARRHNLFVIEDAAQAIGAAYRGNRAGSIGDIGCLSFFPSKNLGCAGDGGMVTTNDESLAKKLAALRSHGTTKKYFHEMVGGNFRLDAIHAAVLLVKLDYLDGWHSSRQQVASRYRQLLTDAALDQQLVLPAELENRTHVYNQFCIRTTHRDGLLAHLKQEKIGTAIYYPKPMHLQQCFADLGYQAGDLPVSERCAEEIIALPMFPTLALEQQQRVVQQIATFLESA